MIVSSENKNHITSFQSTCLSFLLIMLLSFISSWWQPPAQCWMEVVKSRHPCFVLVLGGGGGTQFFTLCKMFLSVTSSVFFQLYFFITSLHHIKNLFRHFVCRCNCASCPMKLEYKIYCICLCTMAIWRGTNHCIIFHLFIFF